MVAAHGQARRSPPQAVRQLSASLRIQPHIPALESFPSIPFVRQPTPVDELQRLRESLGMRARLLVKRDDAIAFGFGGNKVRKLALTVADAVAQNADSLVTIGGVQSNHARVTAAAAAKLGLKCVLVANGSPPNANAPLRGNALLDHLFGAEVVYVASREERVPRMAAEAERLRASGHRPYTIPLGASTPLGAIGFVRAVGELMEQGVRPTVIIHAASSGGTQAGLIAGCRVYGLDARVIGVSADDPAPALRETVAAIVRGIGTLAQIDSLGTVAASDVEVDDRFVGGGYGIPTESSGEAQSLAARTEALIVDHTYSAKALGALITWARDGRFDAKDTVLFWHTGGQVGVFV